MPGAVGHEQHMHLRRACRLVARAIQDGAGAADHPPRIRRSLRLSHQTRNNGHRRCPQGVACGGHAWSEDGLTWSDLVVGAYGPRIPLSNGSYWQNAYIERPQVLQPADDRDGDPIAFFTGMGRSSYVDSCSWVQRFCTQADLDADSSSCAPTGLRCDYETGPKGLPAGYYDFRCPCQADRPDCDRHSSTQHAVGGSSSKDRG